MKDPIKYYLLIHYVHSYLHSVSDKLKIIDVNNELTSVDNFRKEPVNEFHCQKIFEICESEFNYELSWNQMANGINLFLTSKTLKNMVK